MSWFVRIKSNGRIYLLPVLQIQKLVFKSMNLELFYGSLQDAFEKEKSLNAS